jgi:hypothetical protein
MTTRFAAILLVVTLTTVAWIRRADAQKLVLLEPSGSLAAAVRREMRETMIDLLIVHGDNESPKRIGIEQDARFVVWREGGAYVFWDGLARTSRRREASGLEDEISATQVAADILAWVVAAGDTDYDGDPGIVHDGLAESVLPARPLYRIEMFLGQRLNVGPGHNTTAGVGLTAVRRIGAIEVGLGTSSVEEQRLWDQTAFFVHVRAPWHNVGRTRGTLIPRVGIGVLKARLKELNADEAHTFPVAELGAIAEIRWHRFSFAADAAASLHGEQSFTESSTYIRRHVESVLTMRFGLLLY